MYDIRVDQAHQVLSVTLGGMMTTAEVAAYIAEVKRSIVANRLLDYAMVIDVSDCPIQQQSMTEAMKSHMATMPKARALAVVTGNSLARMQVRRLFTQPYARIVATVEEGMAWVVAGTEPESAPAQARSR